jgi:Peptidase_C39 like family
MNKRVKYAILTVALIQIGLIVGLLALPPLVRALPGEYRVRIAKIPLGEMLLDIGVTPLPTSLPIPAGAVANPQVIIPAIAEIVATPTQEATAVPTQPAPVKEEEEDVTVTAVTTTTPTITPLPTVAPTAIPLPSRVRLDGVTIIPQGFNNCGPANLAINLNFYGDPTTQAEAAAWLKPNREDRNVSPWQMVDYVNERTNLRAFFGAGGDMELIKQLVAAGYPVVVEKGYELPTQGWLGHYLTIFGYDDETGETVSMDTNLGPWDASGRYDKYEDLEYYWGQFNYNYFLVYPPEKEEEVYAILGPDMIDTQIMWQNAAAKAQAEMEADPENAFAWFNLGTSLTRLGELTGKTAFYENGAAAFDQAFILGLPPRILWYQYRPYIAYMKVGRYQDMIDLADAILESQGGRNVEETYLYKGHALVLQGDGPGAVIAYQQALRLNENFYPAEIALNSITGENN